MNTNMEWIRHTSLCENIDTHNETPVWQLYCKHCFSKRYLKSVRNGECTKMLIHKMLFIRERRLKRNKQPESICAKVFIHRVFPFSCIMKPGNRKES